ncbi:MAG: DNA internalization-related competence protein ComEC/Rec2 [Desulfomonilaceae bacterium]|jgi:competence protein ComEC
MIKKYGSLGEWIIARPASIAFIAMVVGILLARLWSKPIDEKIITLFLVFALGLGIATQATKNQVLVWSFLVSAFLLLGFSLATDSSKVTPENILSSKKRVITARVSRVLANSSDYRIILLESGQFVDENLELPGRGRLSLRENSAPLIAGDLISFRSSVRIPANRGNPGEYDWEMDCKSESINWLVNARGPQSVVILRTGSPVSPYALLSRLRQSMSKFLEKYSGRFFSPADASAIKAIHKGIILGDRAEIDSELNKAFSNSGLVHMLSASGSHVTIVAAMTFFSTKLLLRFFPYLLLWIPLPKIAAFFCIPTISVYCFLVGLKPPAMRAGIVGVTLALALISERKWDSLNSLALSALLIVLFYPFSIFTPSFQLSFAAVSGILIIIKSPFFLRISNPNLDSASASSLEKIGSKEKPGFSIGAIKRPILAIVLSSFAATMAITPLIVHMFHSVPLYSIPANLAADCALTVGLSLGLISTFFGAFFPEIGQWLLAPADVFVWIVIKIAVFTDKLPWATLKIPNLGYWGLLVSCATTLVTFCFLLKPTKKVGLIALSSWGILIGSLLVGQVVLKNSPILRIVFLNVGNADATFIKPPGASGIFIDTGPGTPYFDAGRSIIAPFLLWQAVSKLEAIIISHPQADHMGGTGTILENFKTETLFINPAGESDSRVTNLTSFARSLGTKTTFADTSIGEILVGSTRITFVHPKASAGLANSAKINDISVVARLDYRNFSALFTGDLERGGANELLGTGTRLSVTVLKVPHHGGKTSATSRDFLRSVHPRIAVISAEYPPKGGLPDVNVIDRLTDAGASVYWTGKDGAITIETDGINSLKVITGKDNKKLSFPNAMKN